MDSEEYMAKFKCSEKFPISFFMAIFFLAGVLMCCEFACTKPIQNDLETERLKEIHFWRKEFKEFKEQERIKKQQEDSWRVMDQSIGLSKSISPKFKPGDYVICLDRHKDVVAKVIRVVPEAHGPYVVYELEIPNCKCKFCMASPIWEDETDLKKEDKL